MTTEQMCRTAEGRDRLIGVAASLGIVIGCAGTVILCLLMEDVVKFAVPGAVMALIVNWRRASAFERKDTTP